VTLGKRPVERTGLRVFNTLSRTLECFVPLEAGKVGVYGCGPTVYGHAHIGNFRSFIFYDLVHRYLEWKGLSVRFVMNFTDVDDKTIRAASEAGVSLEEYTAPFLDATLEEADALGIRRFDSYPRATGFIARMVELVQTLLERGMAYRTADGSVFFDISAFPEYGRLSGKDLDEMRSGERVATDDYGKDDVRDFALWKAAKEEDDAVGAAWDAPWGRGRPGWHLECSAMALSELGHTLDLHLGGEDLVFPHHEDEIAQSEGATGKPFVKYWMHVKHLRVEGRKMSKSLGNFITVRELLDDGVSPAAIRHLLLSAQYRSDLNFTREGLEASGKAVGRLLDFRARLKSQAVSGSAGPTEMPVAVADLREGFESAMDDDFNASGAFGELFVFLNRANAILDRVAHLRPDELEEALAVLESVDGVLGIIELGTKSREVDASLAAWVEERVAAREQARRDKDWTAADAIRDELAERGIVLEDAAGRTRWKRVGTES
jgi:cysteinyl-tRNA synthetase